MSNLAPAYEPALRMTRAEYRAWAQQQAAGRYERVNGVVVAMAPERAGHNIRKGGNLADAAPGCSSRRPAL